MPSRTASRTYGTISADRRKQMSGLEFVQGIAEGTLPLNTLAQTLGYDVSEAVSGRVVVTAVPSGIHLNPAGVVHGGFAATLLDSCMGLALQTTLEKGLNQTTLEFQVSLLRADYAGHRPGQGRRPCHEPGPPGRHRRRTAHRQQWPLAGPWHHHLPDF